MLRIVCGAAGLASRGSTLNYRAPPGVKANFPLGLICVAIWGLYRRPSPSLVPACQTDFPLIHRQRLDPIGFYVLKKKIIKGFSNSLLIQNRT